MASRAFALEQRQDRRFALHLPATMRERGKARFRVTLVDLSVGGCRVEIPAPLPPGSWVWLNVIGLETQYCRLVWCHDTFAGLEFAAPLNPLVVRNLVGDQPVGELGQASLKAIATRCRQLADHDSDASAELAALARECTAKAIGDALAARYG